MTDQARKFKFYTHLAMVKYTLGIKMFPLGGVSAAQHP